MRLTYMIPLALFLFILGLAAFMLTQTKDEVIPSQMVTKPLPEFELEPATDGVKGATRADFADGKPKLLNIWASWCVPCIAEAPQLEALKEKGVDEIVGTAVNDAFVMGAWNAAAGSDDITMLADGNADFAEAVGLTMDGTGFGMGKRGQRFSMVINDGVVEQLNVEAPGDFKVSSAEHMLGQL